MGYAHELIGMQLKVVDSTSKNLVDLVGLILDESRETITLGLDMQNGNLKQVKLLKRSLLKIKLHGKSGKTIDLNGDDLLNKPWDRIKG
ncbi:hypothetical protein HOA92_01730 [archaeon]|jgi:ribonuclease P protein subunit POP4|nr:hypothetical protein [archaeon]MBT6761733.1 hypothetical protein [archaeon]